jgi:drug/metabolite transporter (DMT)-like permease
LSLAALVLVLGSAAVHALWNALLADADDTHASTAVMLLAGVALFAPVAALTWDVDAAAVPYVLASGALELLYLGLLATAYARAELSFVYPVARGSAPVVVLVVSVPALGASVSAWQAAGVLAVAAGVMLVRGLGAGRGADLALALGIGACIAAYTLVDDHGLRHAAPIPYLALVLAVAAVPYAATVGPSAIRRAATGRALLAGAGMFGAYALALAALELAEAAPVAALRETSVVMAAVGAAVVGRARVPAARVAGACAVVAGAAAIALG